MAGRYIPKRYKCVTATDFEEALSRAADGVVKASGLTAAQIRERYPSIRLHHLRTLDEGDVLKFRMSCAIIETLGGGVEVMA